MFHRVLRYRSSSLLLSCVLFACGGHALVSSADADPAGAAESGDASAATAADGSSATSEGGPNGNADASARPGPGDSSTNDPTAPPAPGVPPASAVHCRGGDNDVTCAKGQACCTDGWSNTETTASCLSPGHTCEETSDIATRVTCDGTNCPHGSACCGTYRIEPGGGIFGITETYCALDCHPNTQTVLCDIHAAVDICASVGAVCAPSHYLPAGYYVCAWAP
jgi:hypothetical protein